MALTTAQVADLKDKHQRFEAQIVAFSAVPWSVDSMPAAGAITWYPLCLISPRYSFGAVNDTITLYATDSYIRPFTACTDWTWSKVSGNGSIVDNGDGTGTVTVGSGEAKFQCIVKENGAAAESTTGYAYVYGGAAGNATALITEISNFSGDLDSGEWAADVTFRGDYSGVLSSNGEDQPVLMHSDHFWDGSESTFGGYKRHENTFILLCREVEFYEKYGDYYTRLRLETPAYILKTIPLPDELKFKNSAASGFYSTANLTPTDVAYYILYNRCNYHQYFNVSLWNNSIEVANLNVRAESSVWDAVRDVHGYNFGVCYMNRWSNLNGKPDPRYRRTEWDAIAGPVYDAGDKLTEDHLLEYTIYQRRCDLVKQIWLQAVTPDLTLLERQRQNSVYDTGTIERITSLVADNNTTLDNWGDDWLDWHNRAYDMDFTMLMGHELGPGDVFYFAGATHPLEGGTIGGDDWLCTNINYSFDFARGFWTRNLSAGVLDSLSEI